MSLTFHNSPRVKILPLHTEYRILTRVVHLPFPSVLYAVVAICNPSIYIINSTK